MRALLFLISLRLVTSNFDSASEARVQLVINSVLDVPETHSTLIQDGFKSRFFLNYTGIEYGSLGSMLFAQIRTLSTSFYHLWAGFESGAFLGYYQPDTNVDDRYSLSWMDNASYSCSDYNISTSCREFFAANRQTGRQGYSVTGAVYDCRKRGWYSNTKASLTKTWTSLYIDQGTGFPAFALCAPLVNLTTKATDLVDVTASPQGLVGVACTGVYISAISDVLLSSFTDLSEPGLSAFIVDSTTGLLVAAGTSVISDYFNETVSIQIKANESQNDVIRFATATMWSYTGTNNFPDNYTTVGWVENQSLAYPNLNYEAYYVSSTKLTAPGLIWDIVVIQEVECPKSYHVDTQSFVCTECRPPDYSSGGGTASCDRCVDGYYKDSQGNCEICPTGATCNGKSSIENLDIDKSYWRISATSDSIYKCPLKGACIGGRIFSSSGDSYCVNNRYRGPLCAVCSHNDYLSDGKCIACQGNGIKGLPTRIISSPLLIVFFMVLCMAFSGFIFQCFHGEEEIKKEQEGTEMINNEIKQTKLTLSSFLQKIRATVGVKLKSLLAFFQIAVSIGFNCNISFPDVFEKLVVNLQFVNLDVLPALGLNCNYRFDYIDSLVLRTVAPLSISCSLLLFYELLQHRNRKHHIRKATPEMIECYVVPEVLEGAFKSNEVDKFRIVFAHVDTNLDGSINKDELHECVAEFEKTFSDSHVDRAVSDMFKEASLRDDENIYFDEFLYAMVEARRLNTTSSFSILVDKVEASVNRESGQMVFFIFLFVSYLVLAGNSTALFQYLKCHRFPEAADGIERYLYIDYSIDCDSNRYKAYLPYVYIMILIYPLGIPLMYGLLLYSHRHILMNKTALEREERSGFPNIGHITFLAFSYKTNFFWFEVLECFRRILLASVIGLASVSTAMVPALGVLCSLGFTWVFNGVRPFKRIDETTLSIISSNSLILIFICAFMIKVDATVKNNSDANKFGWVMTFILFTPIIYICGYLLLKEKEEETWMNRTIRHNTTVSKREHRKDADEVKQAYLDSIADEKSIISHHHHGSEGGGRRKAAFNLFGLNLFKSESVTDASRSGRSGAAALNDEDDYNGSLSSHQSQPIKLGTALKPSMRERSKLSMREKKDNNADNDDESHAITNRVKEVPSLDTEPEAPSGDSEKIEKNITTKESGTKPKSPKTKNGSSTSKSPKNNRNKSKLSPKKKKNKNNDDIEVELEMTTNVPSTKQLGMSLDHEIDGVVSIDKEEEDKVVDGM